MMNYLNQVMCGDARLLSSSIEPESVDMVMADPPYHKEFLPLYTWLAQESARVLKPGGFLLTYAGNMYKHEVMMRLGEHLAYFWDYIALHAGMGTMVWPKNTVARHKSILAYVKGQGKPRCRTLGVWTGTGTDKRYHRWGQDESTARYYIDCFTLPGEIIYDPFCGGGTTAVACRFLGRQFITFEIDPVTASRAQQRIVDVHQLPLLGLDVEQLSLVESEIA